MPKNDKTVEVKYDISTLCIIINCLESSLDMLALELLSNLNLNQIWVNPNLLQKASNLRC